MLADLLCFYYVIMKSIHLSILGCRDTEVLQAVSYKETRVQPLTLC